MLETKDTEKLTDGADDDDDDDDDDNEADDDDDDDWQWSGGGMLETSGMEQGNRSIRHQNCVSLSTSQIGTYRILL